jgi:hypothetical protein
MACRKFASHSFTGTLLSFTGTLHPTLEGEFLRE